MIASAAVKYPCPNLRSVEEPIPGYGESTEVQPAGALLYARHESELPLEVVVDHPLPPERLGGVEASIALDQMAPKLCESGGVGSKVVQPRPGKPRFDPAVRIGCANDAPSRSSDCILTALKTR